MKHTLPLILGSALLLTLAACRAPDTGRNDSVAAPMELKIYTVPIEQAAKLGEALGNTLGKSATVTVPAPDKLLVYASHDAQASIGTAIAALGKTLPIATSSTQAQLYFWIVDADTGAGVDDAALKPLSSTLDAVRQTMGPLHFRLDQVAAAMTSSGRATSLVTTAQDGYSRDFNFQVVSMNDNIINLQLRYDDHGQSGLATLETRIDIPSGHYVVLAQAPGACPPALPGKAAPPCPQKPALRLLVVRADRLNPPA